MLQLLLTSALLAMGSQDTVPLPPSPEPVDDLLRRVVVIGASLSNCQGIDDELLARIDWSDFWNSALLEPHTDVVVHADSNFQLNPRQRATKVVEAAQAEEPSMVIAIDFLAPFVYGSRFRVEQQREIALQRGLELLERFDCPILIGDIPDWSTAADGIARPGRARLTPVDLPSVVTLEKINIQLQTWAVQRPHVTVLPVARFYAAIRGAQEFELRGNVWRAEPYELLLQEDYWHPNADGMIALTLHMLDRLASIRPDVNADQFEWESAKVKAKLLERTADERKRREERQRKRAERERRRAENAEQPTDDAPGKQTKEKQEGGG